MTIEQEQALIEQVADWLVIMQEDEVTERDIKRFNAWLNEHPSHQDAWSKAHCFLNNFNQLPDAMTSDSVLTMNQNSRRSALKLLTMALVLPSLGYVGFRNGLHQYAYADHITQIGESRSVKLADGTLAELNTNTKLISNYTKSERLLRLLSGEVFIKTHKDNHLPVRPFRVLTDHGTLEALGTEFNVQVTQHNTILTVFSHAVKVTTSNFDVEVKAGERLVFNEQSHGAITSESLSTAMWRKGLLVASAMPLEQVIAELRRYHFGYFRVEPKVSRIRVSGTFEVKDLIGSLALLEQSLPIDVSYRSKWWVTISSSLQEKT